MKIVQITPGSGDSFFCENCLRDDAAVRELIKLGHDVRMVPLYLPVLDKRPGVDTAPIFFGGINVFLQQKLGVFRHTPHWLDKILDRPALLRLAARFSAMTSPADLGRTTLSMLSGPAGRQAKELARLVDWLAAGDGPQIVVLSNVLLAGLAGEIKRRLGCKIACLLQDEDEFLDSLPQPYRSLSWARLATLANNIDMFIAASDSYRQLMLDRLALPPAGRVCVVRNGVDPADFPPRSPQNPPPEPPAVGFLSRAYALKGLDTLVWAFAILRAGGGDPRLRLRLAGGMLGEDQPYVKGVRKLIAANGLADCVDFLPNLDLPRRRDFYATLRVLCVPERRNQAGGLYVLESMASGVPVVEPDCGVFPELIAGGGGLLVSDQSPAGYARVIGRLLSDSAKAAQMGRQGRLAVEAEFTAGRMAKELSEIYGRIA